MPGQFEGILDKLQAKLGKQTIRKASTISRPRPKREVQQIQIFNEFNRRNPRADGGSVNGSYEAALRKKIEELMDEGYEFGEAVREAMRQGYKDGGIATPKRGLVDEPGSYAGVRLNVKPVGNEAYIKTFETGTGAKKYGVFYSRSGFNRKAQFDRTPEGLEKAKKARAEFNKEFLKFKKEKSVEGVLDSAIKKLKNPPDPKKPWRYLRSGSSRPGGKAKRKVEYFATEAQAKAAQAAAKKAKTTGQTKVPQSDFNKIKARIKKGDTLEQIAKTYKSSTKPITKLLKDNNTSYTELTPNVEGKAKTKGSSAYLNDKKSLDYVKKNYGKLKSETMGKALYPDLPPSTQQSRVRKLVSKLISEKEITAIPASMIEEYRKEKGFDPETSKKKVRDIRKKKIKKFSVPAFEKAMEGSKASQLSHLDDLGSQIVRFETLGYSPQRINQEILKNVDPYLNQLYKERDKLLKNKPEGYVNKVNKINDKGAAVAYGTKGYKSFKVEEPITGRTYRLGYDASKTVDPFGMFEGKTIQEQSPKKIKKTSKALEQIIPDPIDRYFFIENAKAVQEAQAKVSKAEMDKIAKNLEELGFDTDPYKKKMLNIKGERMTPIEYMLAEEAKQKTVPQTRKDKILKGVGKGLTAIGKVAKPVSAVLGPYAVMSAASKADEMGIKLGLGDQAMAFYMGDPQAAIDMYRMRNDPEYAKQVRAANYARPLDEGTYDAIDESFTSYFDGGIVSVLKGVK